MSKQLLIIGWLCTGVGIIIGLGGFYILALIVLFTGMTLKFASFFVQDTP